VKFDQVRKIVGATPYMAMDEAWELYHFILDQRPHGLLELGHAHGVSSLYMAAALDELGEGTLDTVDLTISAARVPNIEELLATSGLGRYVRVHRERSSYTWFLKQQLEAHAEPIYDFCFIDGPKNWTIDGLAFFLVDRLLREGGWILFDDYGWTHARHQGREATDGISIRSLSDDEIQTPQIEAIFRLLVMRHPGYSNFKLQDGWWAWAQKRVDGLRELAVGKKALSASS
jgi:predicted O-methyltransferase YrrM